MKKHIPNFITICNLLCGVFAVLVAVSGVMSFHIAALLIFAGAVFDFFDGFAARLLKANSPIGKELDSMADLITFGFAPAAMLSALIQHMLFGAPFTEIPNVVWQEYVLIFTPYVIVPFSALRLAKFNIDTRQSHSFIGLPTPANALFFASLVFFPSIPVVFLAFLSIIFSLLLVSEIPMFSLKFQTFRFTDNAFRYIFIAIAAISIAAFQLLALPFIILAYIASSIALYLLGKNKGN